MEINKVTIFMKLKGGQMKKNIKVLREGKNVVPNLKRTTAKAIRDTRRNTY
jgi:hypothetical protein